jgi:ATP-binding cassette subfamily A (ABC1) protein 3
MHLINDKFDYFFNQFQALMIKRFIHSIRNKSLIISQLIIPIVILIINLVYIKYGPIKGGDSPSLNIQISKYGKNFIPVNTFKDKRLLFNHETLGSLSNSYIEQFRKFPNAHAHYLNDTSTAKYCKNHRISIDDYLRCLGDFSYTIYNTEYFIGCEMHIDELADKIVCMFISHNYNIKNFIILNIYNFL